MAPLRDGGATLPASWRPFGDIADGCSETCGHIAMGRCRPAQKVDPPGGQPGGSGSAREWMRRPCRTQIHEKRLAGRCPVRLKKTLLKEEPSQPQKISKRRYGCGRCNCRRRRTGEPSRSGDSRRNSSRRCWRRSRCRRSAAPTRPAPTPQCSGLACAWVVEAIVPVTARVARARAANLVSIDMEAPSCVGAAHRGPHAQLDGAPSKAVRNGVWQYGFVVYFFVYFSYLGEYIPISWFRRNISGSNLSTSSSSSQNARAP